MWLAPSVSKNNGERSSTNWKKPRRRQFNGETTAMRLRTFRTRLAASLRGLPVKGIDFLFDKYSRPVLEEIRLGGVCSLQAGSITGDSDCPEPISLGGAEGKRQE